MLDIPGCDLHGKEEICLRQILEKDWIGVWPMLNGESYSLRLEAWWVLKDSFEKEVKFLWESTSDEFLINSKRKCLKKELTKKLEKLTREELDDENLAQIINNKIQLNLEIDEDKMY
ncbi:hypothetical protein EPI10_024679 [Gossypium australe]|uniref:Uncharacterized protein n=1 Tax=Gossypium australe TaxID=47621 RepID=A0A5B6VZI1_9ROSI|nr:hypothetical protein EPI10_024679 [Gossypium australe]